MDRPISVSPITHSAMPRIVIYSAALDCHVPEPPGRDPDQTPDIPPPRPPEEDIDLPPREDPEPVQEPRQ